MANTQQDFTYDPRRPVRILSVKVNGGSVKLQTRVGTDWIDTGDEFFFDGSHPINQYNQTIRIIPSGGAEYEYQ